MMKNRRKNRSINELAGFICLVIAILIFLSLISYKSTGTNFLGDRLVKDTNIIGPLGNRLADGLLQMLGIGSYLIVFCLVFIAYYGISTKASRLTLISYIPIVGLLITSSSILSIIFPHDIEKVKYSGGILGRYISNFLKDATGIVGSVIILVALLITFLLIITKTSPLKLISSVFSLSFGLINKLRLLIARIKKKRRSSLERLRDLNSCDPNHINKKVRTKIIIKRNNGYSDQSEFSYEKKNDIDQPIINRHDSADQLDEETKFSRKIGSIRRGHYDRVSTAPRITDLQEIYNKPSGSLTRGRQKGWQLPSIDLLEYKPSISVVDESLFGRYTMDILNKFKEFKINGTITEIHPGPVVTTYEFKPAPSIKYSKVISLVEDLSLALKAENIRMARMPGKSTIAIEVPNPQQKTIYLREIIDSPVFQSSKIKLTLALGKTIEGKNYVTDLSRMPHLLVAGTTGSGKSVSINAMICSILYNATPDEVKFIMIDPKRLELGIYDDIPHLLTPVVTDPKLATAALMWAVHEMNVRLEKMSKLSVRNIQQYNQAISTMNMKYRMEHDLQPLPYLVVVVDELSDLMILATNKVEEAITRLSQMARAVGIHLILATQRPSVDVITGKIKANLPSRISFRVFSKFDSRTIIEYSGAEKLLGKGDMLFVPPGTTSLIRLHGPLVTENEIERVIKFWKKQGRPLYDERVEEQFEAVAQSTFSLKGKRLLLDSLGGFEDDDEIIYLQAKRIVVSSKKASISNLQRKLKIGYNRAARMMDMMEEEGIVGPADGAKPRSVIVEKNYLDE